MEILLALASYFLKKITATTVARISMLLQSQGKALRMEAWITIYATSQMMNEYHTVQVFNFKCKNIPFTALLEGICATFNVRIQALKLNHNISRILIWGMLFWRYHSSEN